VEATAALAQAVRKVRAMQDRVGQQARDAYMTGQVGGLDVLADAQNLADLLERSAALNFVAASNQDLLGQLQLAKREADLLHAAMVRAEREQQAAAAEVAGQLRDLQGVLAVRRQAKRALDARVAQLARTAGALRARSAELRRLIREEELARARAAAARRAQVAAGQVAAGRPAATGGGSGPRCDLSGTSAAERWIIMHESGGLATADNPTSTAFGLGQLLLGNRILYLGSAYATTDCGRQLGAFRAYVRDRYGTAANAQAFWQAHGWY
jgi:hypothetical protein